MSAPTLLAVAHGSKHPAAADATRAVARQISRLAPVLDVRVAYVQHAEPSLAAGLDTAGRNVVIVPLLLSGGYHLATDIASAAHAAGARVAAPLGPDPLLVTALAGRLTEAGVPTGTPVVLAAAGSSDPQALADARRQAELIEDVLGAPVIAAFAASARPTVDEAIAALRARSGGPVAVAAYLLAPGTFHDRLRQTAAAWVTAPLGGHPAVAAVVIDRYRVASAAA